MLRARQAKGFTLLEVMVALAIVALSLTTVAASMNRMIGSATTMQERTYASWIAQNKIAEIRLANVMPEVGTSSGEIEFGNTLWVWRAVVAETGVANFRRIEVFVSNEDDEYQIVMVTGFIGEPQSAPGRAFGIWR
ncbi:MAG: type II secretion system minor pseudopilin GspI [Woeseiaceae bacterium]|nr:type II secretion system minor pseudopilin GspI [Woeseiaceae bacterium]